MVKIAIAGYSALTEETETNSTAPKFKVGCRVRITKYKNLFSKGYTNSWSREIFVIDSLMKANPCIYKSKYINEEKIIRSSYKNELLLSKL